jgi:outer membrane lipoprotein-sorting protein
MNMRSAPPGPCRCLTAWLLAATLLMGAVATQAEPLSFPAVLAGMKKHWSETKDYQCRFETESSNGETSREVVLAYFYRRPAQIRMEVLEGPYAESLLLYNRAVAPRQVRVRAGNPLVAFLQRMLYGEFFAVDHEWMVDLRGNGIHESDWTHFIAEHEKYLRLGATSCFLGEEILNGRKSFRYRLISKDPEKTTSIKEEEVWVDAETYFPVKYFQYGSDGRLLRKAVTTELRFNEGLSERLFLEFDIDID